MACCGLAVVILENKNGKMAVCPTHDVTMTPHFALLSLRFHLPEEEDNYTEKIEFADWTTKQQIFELVEKIRANIA